MEINTTPAIQNSATGPRRWSKVILIASWATLFAVIYLGSQLGPSRYPRYSEIDIAAMSLNGKIEHVASSSGEVTLRLYGDSARYYFDSRPDSSLSPKFMAADYIREGDSVYKPANNDTISIIRRDRVMRYVLFPQGKASWHSRMLIDSIVGRSSKSRP